MILEEMLKTLFQLSDLTMKMINSEIGKEVTLEVEDKEIQIWKRIK